MTLTPSRIWIFLGIGFIAFGVQAAPAGLTLQGRLVKDDVAVTGAVTMTVSVRSPNAALCLLMEENHSFTLAASEGGIFSVQIGSGTRTINDKGFTLTNVFSNTGTAINSLVCPGTGGTSYTPAAGDSRYVYLSFATTVGTVSFAAPYVVQSVPYALEAEKLDGKTASQYLQTGSDTTQSKIDAIMATTPYNELLSLINGSSTQYMSASSSAGTTIPVLASQPASLGAGRMWYENGSIKYYDANSSTVKTLGTGSGSGSVTSIVAGAGLSGGTITTSGTLSLASGVISAAGTYKSVTVDTYGRVTSGTNPASVAEYGITDAVINGGQTGALIVGTSDATAFTLRTNGTTRMTFDASGNIGVGTTPNSSYRMNINGSVNSSGSITAANFYGGWGTSSSPSIYTGGAGLFSNGSGILGFSVGSAERMRIMSSGSIGVGTTSPTALVHLHQGSSSSSALNISRGNNAYTATMVYTPLAVNASTPQFITGLPPSLNGFTVRTFDGTNSTNLMVVQPNGNVGIGTTSPLAKLEVAGPIVSTPIVVSNTATTLDLATSDAFTIATASGAAFTMLNNVNGQVSTVVITDATSRTYTFACTGTTKYKPANAATTSSTTTIYSILSVKNGSNYDCYVTWATGYQ